MRFVRIIVEGLNGPHNLQLGDYFYDEAEETMYVGAGANDWGGLAPVGTIYINENGTYDVSLFAAAEVNVPQGDIPHGTLVIYNNGTYNVASYENVEVYVQSDNLVPATLNMTPIKVSLNIIGERGTEYQNSLPSLPVQLNIIGERGTEYQNSLPSLPVQVSISFDDFVINPS